MKICVIHFFLFYFSDLLLEHNSQLEMKLTDYKNRLALEEEQKQILISRFYYMRQKWGRSRNRFQSPSSAATPSFRADIDGLDSASSPVTPTSPTFHFPGRRYIPAGAGNAAANNAEAKRFVPEPISRQPYLNLQQQQNGKAAPGFLATRPAVPTSMGAHADTTYHIASGSGSSSVVSVRDEKRAKQSRVADMKALHIVDSATASLKHAFPAVVHPQGDKPRSRSNVRVSTGASVDRESALSTPTTAGSHDRKAASFALQTHSPGAESDGVSRSSPAQSRDRSRSSSFSRGVADKGERSDNTASVQDGVRIGNLVFAPSFLVGEQDDEDSFGRHSLGVSNALHRRTPVKEEEDDHSDPELYSALHSESRGGSGAHSRARFLGSPAFTTPQHKGGGAMSKRGDGMICASCRQPQGLKSPGLSKKTVETAQRNVLHALEVRNEAWTSLGSLAKDFMQLLAAIPETRPSTTNSASIPTLTAASATSMALSSLESAARKLVDTVRPIPGTAEHKLKGSPQAKGGAVDTSPSSSILANPVVAQATLALVRSLRTMVLLLMSEETKAVGVEEHRFLMALLQELQSNYLTSASSSPQSKKLSRDGPKGTKKERVGIRLQTIGSDGEDDVTADFQPTKKTDIDTDARESETMSNKHEEQGDNNSPELEDDTIQDAFLDLTSDLFPDTMSLSHAYLTLLRMETLQSARNKTTTCRDCAIKAAVSAASRSPSPASRGMLEAPGSSTSAKMPISARFFTELSHGLGRSPTRNNFQKPLPSPPNAMSPLTTKFLTYTPPPASKKAAFFEGDDEPVAKGGLAKSAFVSAKQVRTTIATENVSPRNTPGKAATLNTVPSNNHSTITVPSIRQSHAAFMSGR